MQYEKPKQAFKTKSDIKIEEILASKKKPSLFKVKAVSLH